MTTQEASGPHCLPDRDRRNQRRVIVWGMAWAASFAAVGVAGARGWLPGDAWIIAAILVSSLLGLGMLLAYRQSLREGDELRRKVELDAMALALGVGLVGGWAYQLLETGGVSPTPAWCGS